MIFEIHILEGVAAVIVVESAGCSSGTSPDSGHAGAFAHLTLSILPTRVGLQYPAQSETLGAVRGWKVILPASASPALRVVETQQRDVPYMPKPSMSRVDT
jgi:hypothetical protein